MFFEGLRVTVIEVVSEDEGGELLALTLEDGSEETVLRPYPVTPDVSESEQLLLSERTKELAEVESLGREAFFA